MQTQSAQETSVARRAKKDWKTSLRAIAEKAKQEPKKRFGSLCQLLTEEALRTCFYQLRKDAASGVDRVNYRDYEKNLEGNLKDLVGRLKRKGYRPQMVRRKNIPKGNGKLRPLGIPALEDKLVQLAVSQILLAIYEGDFLESSYGYRMNRGAHDAVRDLTDELFRGNYQFVAEADIRGFFDNIDHEWMVRMLAERVEDGALIRLIRKWLRAGILEEDGKVIHPQTGTPQGGVISPVLANIYLHYVLDLWFERRVKKANRGRCEIYRFADDFVACFEYRHEAEAFERKLEQRLAEFGLEVAEEKTKTLRFGRNGGPHNGRFDFLGFEFSWARSRKGKPYVRRRTSRKNLRESIRRMTEWIRSNRHVPIKRLMKTLASKLRGTWNYYGVIGNSRDLSRFYTATCRVVFKWLNRRSQKRSFTWTRFNRMLKRFQMPQPRITERPEVQMPCQLELIIVQRAARFML